MATFAQSAAAVEGLAKRASAGAEAAANAMADVFKPAVQEKLTARRHPFATKTPSAPGEPPAAISGALAGSMLNTPAIEVGVATWEAKSGPTIRYARIQELGGVMTGHPLMHWREDGVPHWSHQHALPPRPYMLPTAEELCDSGVLGDAAAAAFEAVLG